MECQNCKKIFYKPKGSLIVEKPSCSLPCKYATNFIKSKRQHKKIGNKYYIALTKDKLARVDKSDFEYLSQFNWYAQVDRKTGEYSARRAINKPGIRKQIIMHREIMKCPDHLIVDHINHDTLDNRKSNLRIVTYEQNGQNKIKRANTSSKFIGVSFKKK